MNEILDSLKKDKFQELLPISLINKTIDKLSEENINNNNENYNDDKIDLIVFKISEKMFSLYKKQKEKQFMFGILKLSKFLEKNKNYNKVFKMQNYNEIVKETKINESIVILSNIFLLDLINNNNHNFIQKYIKILLLLIMNKILKTKNFYLILDIFLKTVINRINNINIKKLYKYLKLNEEPLLFINDIIEGIINLPLDILSNNILL